MAAVRDGFKRWERQRDWNRRGATDADDHTTFNRLQHVSKGARAYRELRGRDHDHGLVLSRPERRRALQLLVRRQNLHWSRGKHKPNPTNSAIERGYSASTPHAQTPQDSSVEGHRHQRTLTCWQLRPCTCTATGGKKLRPNSVSTDPPAQGNQRVKVNKGEQSIDARTRRANATSKDPLAIASIEGALTDGGAQRGLVALLSGAALDGVDFGRVARVAAHERNTTDQIRRQQPQQSTQPREAEFDPQQPTNPTQSRSPNKVELASDQRMRTMSARAPDAVGRDDHIAADADRELHRLCVTTGRNHKHVRRVDEINQIRVKEP